MEKSSVESLLLLLLSKGREEENKDGYVKKKGVIIQEVKKLCYIALPMVGVNFGLYFLQIVSMMMVGHLGKLQLSSTAVAFSLSGVTGFSLLFGMSSAMETLCGQAFGAKHYRKLGHQAYAAILSMYLVCIPVSLLWIFMGKCLTFLGQDPIISEEAGKFMVRMLPALFAYGTIQALIRYFQTQSLVIPLLVSSGATFCLHVPLCWFFVFKTGLGHRGAPLAVTISYWFDAILLLLYMMYSSKCEKTRVPVSMELVEEIVPFFRLAVPSAIMICLEWWSFEVLVLLSGLLPNPTLETSVLSVCVSTLTALNMIPDGLGAGASTRVSNELGAGNPEGAKLAVRAVMYVMITESVILCASLFASRHVFGYIFSSEKEVVDYVAAMASLLCISVVLDNFQQVLSGIARGSGWQDKGAYINLGAYYLCGLPVSAILCFRVHLRGWGLWIGIILGACLQTALLLVITFRTDWEKQAIISRERLCESKTSPNNTLIEEIAEVC